MYQQIKQLFDHSNKSTINIMADIAKEAVLNDNDPQTLVSIVKNVISLIASLAMIFGGVVPYIPQYRIINLSRNVQGFSTYVCLSLLVANILRILFWFGHPFELPLLIQSVIMIVCMLIMLHLCVKIKQENSGSLITNPKKFTDFDSQFFWKWHDFLSYIHFLLSFCLVGAIMTRLLIDVPSFIETIGFLSVFTEALLGAPQFYRNFINKSTEGMSLTMVIMWTCGDLFKTSYFILRSSPVQFWLCGMLQVSIDVLILLQVYYYSSNRQQKK